MTVTREQRAIAQAELTIGRKLGLGGAAWSVIRPVGEGVSAPVALSPVGAWAGYVADEDPAQLGQAAPATAVGTKRWYAVGAGATLTPSGALAVGDILVSVADSALAFAIAAADLVAGYARYLVTPTAAPIAVGDTALDLGADDGVALAVGMDVI